MIIFPAVDGNVTIMSNEDLHQTIHNWKRIAYSMRPKGPEHHQIRQHIKELQKVLEQRNKC